MMKVAVFTEEDRKEIERIISLYPETRSALIPVLQYVQHRHRCVSEGAVREVAGLFGLSPATVKGVAGFYSMFTSEPVGRYHIQVCTNLCCALRGADKLLAHLKRTLGVDVGGTTPDGVFTLTTVECLGSCGTAPMMQVNDDYYEDLNDEKVDSLIEKWRFDGTHTD